MRNHTDCFGRSGQYLIVLAEAAGMIEPGKRTFHDPAPGKLLPFVRLDFLRNINTTPQSLTGIKRKSPPVSRIGAKALNGWIPLTCLLCRHDPSLCIVDICGMHHHRQQISQCIYDDVPLPAFRFFPPSIPRSFATPVTLTFRESRSAPLGSALRPARSRDIFTRCRRVFSHSPLRRARRRSGVWSKRMETLLPGSPFVNTGS